MPDPIPVAREHKKLADELDDVYIETVNAATFGRGYLVHKRGNFHELFFQFYYPFGALFQHTRYLREMKDVDKELIAGIEKWTLMEGIPRPSVLRSGLDLFTLYQKELQNKGAIILKRE